VTKNERNKKMGLIENLAAKYANLQKPAEQPPAEAGGQIAKASGPRPCSQCGGRLFWSDVAGRIHCIECDEPPDVIFVQDYFFVKECDGGFFANKLFLDARETFEVRESPRHTRKVLRWSLPAEAERCGAWADGLGLQGVWACDRASPGPGAAFVRVDVAASGMATFSDWENG
jgi:hypothetical protein